MMYRVFLDGSKFSKLQISRYFENSLVVEATEASKTILKSSWHGKMITTVVQGHLGDVQDVSQWVKVF